MSQATSRTHRSRIFTPQGFIESGGAAPERKTSVVVVRESMTLSGFIPEWEELAASALEPNVFYEHWMLLPALEAFGAERDVCVVLVLIRDPGNRDAPAKLAGLFPLEFVPRVKRLQRPALATWQHADAGLGTPLVRADAVHECMVELLLWLRSGDATAGLMELKSIAADGPFHRAATDLLSELGMMSWVTGTATRDVLRVEHDARNGPEAMLPADLRRRLSRQEKQLRDRGRIERVALEPGDDAARWIEELLRMEANSRDGRRGHAPACSESYRRYFRLLATAAHERGRLIMLGINLDGRAIARSCLLVAGEGAHALKSAFDEEFARFAPDALLELDQVRRLQGLPGVQWVDTGGAARSALLGRLANDRRLLQSVALGGGALEELVVSGLPLLRWADGGREALKRAGR